MNNKTLIFILGIYTSVCVSIMGYFYINPTEKKILKGLENLNLYTLDYSNFKYSILISIVGLILLFSFLQLFRKVKN